MGVALMNIDSLKAFCIVVESGSISKAAKKLFVSQPSLSIKIQELESNYQAMLLERTNRGIKPTDAGLVVYQHAQKILSIGESIERELSRSRGETPELSVCASTTIGNYALPCTIYNFREKYPDYRVNLKITNSEQVIEHIINNRAEVGLVEGPLSEATRHALVAEHIKTKKITTSELTLVVPNKEPWSKLTAISPEKEFRNIPLILREKGSGIRTTLELTLAAQGLTVSQLNVIMELNSTSAILSAVTSGKGVSILPKIAVRKELHYQILKEIQVEGLVFRHDSTTLYRTEDLQKPVHAAFLSFLHSKDRGFC